jgi:hypothetical protein
MATKPQPKGAAMSTRQLSLESLAELDDGKPMAAFNVHLERIARDCMDRPGDAKERAVTLKVICKPVMESDGDCSEVKTQIFVTSSIPTHKTKVYSFGLRRNGVIVFNPESLDSVDQTTMFGDEDDR